eukprot:COSAG05_NODE_3478_length_2036_cov_1.042850_3_plen_144_part_00
MLMVRISALQHDHCGLARFHTAVAVISVCVLPPHADLTEAAVPTLNNYLEPAIDQLKERDNMTEEEKKEEDDDDLYKNDRLFVWCAIRAPRAMLFFENTMAFVADLLQAGTETDGKERCQSLRENHERCAACRYPHCVAALVA